MPKRLTYQHRQLIGNYRVRYLQEVESILWVDSRGYRQNRRYALFLCGCCPNEFRAGVGNVKGGQVKSCGCKRLTADGLSCLPSGEIDPLYELWWAIKKRCLSPKAINYERYGSRGICICDEWKDSFPIFRDWCLDNGYNYGLQIDRINNNGNYEPNNCRFVTVHENSRNKRNNVWCWLDGEKMCITDAAKKLGKSQGTLSLWAQGKYPNRVPSSLVFEEPAKC
jgi:hypothetical protein